MLKLLRSRLTAPLAHIVIFGLTWLLYWLQFFLADLPISVFAFGAMWPERWATPAIVAWGVLGTLWWYLLGTLIVRQIAAKSA